MRPWSRSFRLSAAVLAVLTFVGCGMAGIGGSYPGVCSELGYPTDRCAAIVQSAQERLPVCTVGVECGRSSVTPERVISIELRRPASWDSEASRVIVSVLFHLEAGAPDFYPGVSAGQVDFAVDLGGCGLVGDNQPWCG
jgi:hypothetical protein